MKPQWLREKERKAYKELVRSTVFLHDGRDLDNDLRGEVLSERFPLRSALFFLFMESFWTLQLSIISLVYSKSVLTNRLGRPMWRVVG